MKRIYHFTFFILLYWNGIAQDTIKLYLDANFQRTEEKKAIILRKAVIKNDHYTISDQYVNGPMINYGEYNSINPFVEDGLSKHYENGKIYSVGNYRNGIISGKWIYYNVGNFIDTIDYSLVENYYKNPKDACKQLITTAKDTNQIGEEIRIKEKLHSFVKQNLHFPARLREEKKSFDFNVNFILDTTGYISCPEIINFANIDFDYELLRVLFLFKYDFKINNPINLTIPIHYDIEPSFVFVEKQATFEGGDIGTFRDWVQRNLVYPGLAVEKGIIGRVTVQFAVDSKGEVTDVKILRGVESSLDKETYRIIMSSPKWEPAIQGGSAVRQQFVIPVIFNLK
jgi:TonB family protein